MKKVLAFDFGASSGRAIIGEFNGQTIELKEIHRFENTPITVDGTLYWDLPTLISEVKTGLKKAYDSEGFESVGVDTWGVDFGLIGFDGKLLENPVHYRDSRTDNMMEEAFKIVPKEELYDLTGIQFMQFNTLFQLLYLAKNKPELLVKTDKILFMPDLFAYLLTNQKKTEYTIASTSQMLNPYKKDWDFELLEKMGIPKHILCEIEPPATLYGQLSDELCKELDIKPANVVSVASHDTASAVVAVPAKEDDFIYVSCGTWSLFGTESPTPVINEKSSKANLTNEGGFGGKIRFLKNIMGLWLIQETKRQCQRIEGRDIDYPEFEGNALKCEPLKCFVDPDAPEFLKPGNMHEKVRSFCERTNQYVPQTAGEITRCIYESLAMKYRYTLHELEEITGKKYNNIYIVGGGIKGKLLTQMAADCCNLPISAGPSEATALGNIAVQLIAMGAIKDLSEARDVVRNSTVPAIYEPKQSELWASRYEDFRAIVGK